MVFDLHLHSHYSFATSKNMEIDGMVNGAKKNGIDIIGLSDILHYNWVEKAKDLLTEWKDGIYEYDGIKFVLIGEISLIYKDEGKTKKVHLLIGMDAFEKIEALRKRCEKYGKLQSDGRPILKLNIRDFVDIVLSIDNNPIIIPAHIWTPWYGIMGSKSGYNSLKEAFGQYIDYITALETGLSSDIKMNSMIDEIKQFSLVSFSDAHSPDNIGRELTISRKEINSFHELKEVIEKREIITGEVYPQHGKYFLSGHRKCNYVSSPFSTEKICPVCNKPLTEGVSSRIASLSGNSTISNIQDYFYMVSLKDIFKGRKNRKYLSDVKMIDIYYNWDVEELKKRYNDEIVDLIIKVREGKVEWKPGYDGVYGKMEV